MFGRLLRLLRGVPLSDTSSGKYGIHTITYCGKEYDGRVYEKTPCPYDVPPFDWRPPEGEVWQPDMILQRRDRKPMRKDEY